MGELLTKTELLSITLITAISLRVLQLTLHKPAFA
jgi:hypothetical protein